MRNDKSCLTRTGVLLLCFSLAATALASSAALVYQRPEFEYARSGGYRAFRQSHPGVRLKEYTGEIGLQSRFLQRHLVSKSGEIDIYHSRMESISLPSILRDGYYLPLQGEAAIAQAVQAYYPPVRQALMVGNDIAAVPVGTYFPYVYLLNTAIMQEIGLSEADLPKTLPGLLAFAQDWPQTYGAQFPQYQALYCFVGNPDVEDRNMPAGLVMQAYKNDLLAAGKPLQFDTPQFRSLLQAIAPFTKRPEPKPDDYISDNPQWYECLFYVAWCDSPFYARLMKPLAPLPLRAGGASVQPLVLSVAHLNPYSKKGPLAQQALAAFAQNPEGVLSRVLGFVHTPLEQDYFAQANAEKIKKVEPARLQMEALTAKQSLSPQEEEQLAAARRAVKEYERFVQNEQYRISAQQLEQYEKNIVPRLFICGQTPDEADGFYEQADELLIQYLDGAISADHLIQTLDNAIRLMRLENQ